MSTQRITFLGTGSPTFGRLLPSGATLGGEVVFDAPTTLAWTLNRAGFPPREVRVILISHFHADHTFGLPSLFVELAFGGEPPARPVQVIGPPGSEEWLRTLVRFGYPSPGEQLLGMARVEGRSMAPGEELEVAGYGVRAFGMKHMDVAAQGYAVSKNGVSIGYSGDTEDCEGFQALAGAVDVLLSEATTVDREVPGHLNLRRLESLATPAIFAVHRAYCDAETRDGIIVPQDLECWEVGGGAPRRRED